MTGFLFFCSRFEVAYRGVCTHKEQRETEICFGFRFFNPGLEILISSEIEKNPLQYLVDICIFDLGMGIEFTREFIAASATPLILSVLRKGDSYGYAIIKHVRELSKETLDWSEGMLYPILHRLEKQKLIESYWQKDGGRRRRYYRLLPQGAEALENLKEQWTSINLTMNRSWE